MIDKIYEILKEYNCPVKYITRPNFKDGQAVVISFHDYNRRGAYYGDGKRKQFVTNLQIDIFHKRGLKGLDLKIIKKLEENNFIFQDSSNYDDSLSGIRLYHTVLTFEYLEREVE